ncbi:MAG TPA: SGNH/GDSL hydrolase family protein, partial [Terriglobales bacterium]|nr:SGNH/GDSL hydrolase family protein [Terriglobales bacterium]
DLIERDPNVGFRMVPHYDGKILRTDIPLQTNSWGFREREFGDPPANGLRILTLGDSMVFGQGVLIEETYPRYLEGLLRQRLGVPVEVINGGIPGYGTTQEVKLFEQMVDVVKPDMVLLSIAVFNDVTDNLKFSEQLHRWQGKRSLARQIRWFFRHNSQVYIMLRRYRAGVSGRQMMQIHAHQPSPRTQDGLRLIEESLQRLAAKAAERGIAVGVIINPAHKQASPRVWEETLAKYQLDATEFGYDQPNRRLIDFAEDQGIPMLDLLPVFRSRPKENFYFTEHWQAPGHRLVAEEVASFVERTGLLAKARSRRAANVAGEAAAPDVAMQEPDGQGAAPAVAR